MIPAGPNPRCPWCAGPLPSLEEEAVCVSCGLDLEAPWLTVEGRYNMQVLGTSRRVATLLSWSINVLEEVRAELKGVRNAIIRGHGA